MVLDIQYDDLDDVYTVHETVEAENVKPYMIVASRDIETLRHPGFYATRKRIGRKWVTYWATTWELGKVPIGSTVEVYWHFGASDTTHYFWTDCYAPYEDAKQFAEEHNLTFNRMPRREVGTRW